MAKWNLDGNRTDWFQSVSIALLSFFVVLPPAVLFPKTVGVPSQPVDITLYLLLIVIIFPASIAIIFHISEGRKKEFIGYVFLLGGICSVVAFLFCCIDIRLPIIYVPS